MVYIKMMKTYNKLPQPDLAILVGVGVKQTIDEASLDELSSLCKTCNIHEVGRLIQNRNDVDVTWFIGKGKVEELKILVEQTEANAVVFDVELSGSKVRNLEKELGVPVLDRSKIILDIFASRAQSMEGKLQVELAQLNYNLPRLVGAGGLMSKMKNAVGMRGPGEKKLELDKRKIKEEISSLEKQIRKLSDNRQLNKKQAFKSGQRRVCLVGYTNSGKSTLLNALSKENVLAEDMLFATLDPKTARIYVPSDDGIGAQVLLTDTVGFIDKLPHEFINAFESTLDEARTTDLLLHVVDISNEQYNQQIAVVDAVLAKIGASDVPTLLVLNKVDALSPVALKQIEKEFKGKPYVLISARKNVGLDDLKAKLV